MQGGRVVFGVAAAALGVVTLLLRDSGLWGLGSVQVAAGIGLLHPRTARIAASVLGGVFALFALACIPGIIRAPTRYEPYGNFFEQLSVVCGALAAYAATETTNARATVLGRAARIGLGLCAVSFALAQLAYLQYTARLVPAWIPPSRQFWAMLTTTAFGLAAVAMLVNCQARLAMRLMTLMLVLFGVLVWIPIAGAAWMVAELRSPAPA